MKMRGWEYVDMTPNERLSLAIYGFGFTRSGQIMTPEDFLVRVLLMPHLSYQVRITSAIIGALFEGMTEEEEQDLRHAYLLPSKEGTSERDGEKVALEVKGKPANPETRAMLIGILEEARLRIDRTKIEELAMKMRTAEEARQKIALEKFHSSARRTYVHALVLGQAMS